MMWSPLQQTGLCGERWACAQLEQRKYRVRMLPQFTHPGADLIVEEQLLVEVKLALPTDRYKTLKSGKKQRYTRWQWNVSHVNGQHAECLILVAEDEDKKCYPFIMPAWVMFNRSHFQLTSHPTRYKGYIADFLGNWDVVAFLLNRPYRKSDIRQWWEVPHAK